MFLFTRMDLAKRSSELKKSTNLKNGVFWKR